jgi:tetratricopeptide (TPR) repeat protein
MIRTARHRVRAVVEGRGHALVTAGVVRALVTGAGRLLAACVVPAGVAILLAGWAGPTGAESLTSSSPAAAWLAAGDSAVTRLDLDRAISAYTQACHADPRSYEAAWKLARALTDRATLSAKSADQLRLCVAAESLARTAVALEPRGAAGHTFLAIALGKRALFEGGRRRVRLAYAIRSEADTAIALDSTDDLAHHVLGVWNREIVALSGPERFFGTMLFGKLPQGSLDAALDHLRTATRLHPEVIPHRVELGITLAAAHRDRDAKTELERALAMPTSWVTDDVYRAKARTALARLRKNRGS